MRLFARTPPDSLALRLILHVDPNYARLSFPLRESAKFVVLGLALAATKLFLLPFQQVLPTELLSTLSDLGLTMLVSVAAWRASRRSYPFARALWLSVALAAIFWTVSSGIGVFLLVSSKSLEISLNAFWSTTILFYLVGLSLTIPLLLREDRERTRLDWLQVLDIAQLSILTFSAYLVFFYIPSITGLPEALRVQSWMILHLTRDGFFALAFLYRGWRSRFSDFRRLQFRLAAFFAFFSMTAAFYFHASNVWHWPVLLVEAVADLPILFLLLTAATWQQQVEMPRQAQGFKRLDEIFWPQLLPVIMPITVIALASRASTRYLRVAWIAVTASFLCYAARLLVMQGRQKIAQSKLMAAEEKFSKAFILSPGAITISRLSDGRYIDANDRWLELMKLPRDEIIGKTSVELGIWENPQDRKMMVDAIRKSGSVRSMSVNLQMGGKTVIGLLSAELMELEGETLIVASVVDVTELQNVTQQLRQAQKMELVGNLAGGIAHDFNNLLTIIKGYCELAKMKGLEGEVAREIHQIGEASDKAAALTRQLLALSRRQLLHPRNIALNSVVTGIETMLRHMIGENMEVVFFIPPDLGTVYADPTQIEQVVLNLAVNARDAMPNGGNLRFEGRNLDLTSSYAERGFEIPPGRYILLEVTDTGTGITSEHLDRIFEPFFTTKEVGRGTGLGLSTVYGIVKQSGGYVGVSSEPGRGTTFKIYLPRVDSPADSIDQLVQPSVVKPGSETILLVEDDPAVRQLANSILGARGYRVLAPEHPSEAEQVCAQYSGPIDLLLTDLIMPGIGGRELARRVALRRPKIKVLFMSGYTDDSMIHRRVAEETVEFIPKPFTPTSLQARVREVLDGAQLLPK